MNWKLAPAIEKFRAQINAMFPGRDKVSDGTVGDISHQGRKSSHNPDKFGFVRAMDVTNNPEKGIDGRTLLSALLKSKDSRIWYIIFDRKIYNRKNNFAPEVYTGENAHKHHLHLSVADVPAVYNDASDWDLQFDSITTATAKPASFEVLKIGSKGGAVKSLQEKLAGFGYLKTSDVDGDFGEVTRAAVEKFQRQNHLSADGIVGLKTATFLGL